MKYIIEMNTNEIKQVSEVDAHEYVNHRFKYTDERWRYMLPDEIDTEKPKKAKTEKPKSKHSAFFEI